MHSGEFLFNYHFPLLMLEFQVTTFCSKSELEASKSYVMDSQWRPMIRISFNFQAILEIELDSVAALP